MRPKHAAVRRSRSAAVATRHSAAVRHGGAPASAEDGLLVMDSLLNPIAADPGAAAILNVTNPDNAGRSQLQLPKELHDFLHDHETTGVPATLQFCAGNAGYICRAFVMYPQNVENGKPLVALHFQKDTSISTSIARVAAHYNLTEREKQALEGIAGGLTSKEIAASMNISPNTVKSFLRIIMLKMNVPTRVGLVGKLLEYRDNHNDDHPAA